MDVVGFAQDEKQSIYTLLSAILNLGNVTFDEVVDKVVGHDSVAPTHDKCKFVLHVVLLRFIVLILGMI